MTEIIISLHVGPRMVSRFFSPSTSCGSRFRSSRTARAFFLPLPLRDVERLAPNLRPPLGAAPPRPRPLPVRADMVGKRSEMGRTEDKCGFRHKRWLQWPLAAVPEQNCQAIITIESMCNIYIEIVTSTIITVDVRWYLVNRAAGRIFAIASVVVPSLELTISLPASPV